MSYRLKFEACNNCKANEEKKYTAVFRAKF